MRQSLIDLFKQTVVFQYCLPHGDVQKSVYSTMDDHCYMCVEDQDLSRIIYNSLIDYAFNENEMQDEDINLLHIEAISQRMRIEEGDDEQTQKKYGFFGEVLLNLMLRIYYSTNSIIAKGYFYDILKPEEPKGYDSYHLIETDENTLLWFGEVKFYESYKLAIKSVFNNIEKAISDNYFKNNLLALTPKRRNLETDSQVINQLILELRKNPQISIAEMVEKHRLQLVYPIFILCNYDINYDTTISSMINHIKEKYSGKNLNIGIDYNLFFILLPVSNVAQIKSQVLQWIKSKQSLSLL